MTLIMNKKKWSVSKKWRWLVGLTGIGIVGLAVTLAINTPTQAQEATSEGALLE